MKPILTFLFLFFCTFHAIAQSAWEGAWEGKLSIANIRIVFHISPSGDGFVTKMDSPDQGATGIPIGSTRIFSDSIIIQAPNMGIRFNGIKKNDSTITGNFHQGIDIPLELKKRKSSETVEIKIKPQTPLPPFPYHADSILIRNKKDNITLGATVTYPREGKNFPAIVLITGSGPQDRDETILLHKPFAVLADYFTRKGFLVVRFDDRGTGASTGNFDIATSADFANDASAVVDYLLTRKDVDKSRIGVMGHSEGGLIAPMVANAQKEVDFVVMLAGPGVPIIQLMREQVEMVMRSSDIDSANASAYGNLYTQLMNEVFLSKNDTLTIRKNLHKIVDDWADNASPALLALTGLKDSDSRTRHIQGMLKQLHEPWWSYFMRYDPTPVLQKLHTKTLAINGEKDIQVIPASNLQGIENALKKSASPSYKTIQLTGLNHLFQSCKSCTVGEYGELDETFSPIAMDAIYQWMLKENIAPTP